MVSLRPILVSSLPICTFLLTFTLNLQPTSARCCFTNEDSLCANNLPVVGWCCGNGPCNLFCCSCSGGCIPSLPEKRHIEGVDVDVDADASAGDASINENMASQYAVCTASTGSSIFTGDEDCGSQLFQSLDTEGVGKISLAQYLGWFASKYGGSGDIGDLDEVSVMGAVEYFHRFDADRDGFVDEVEMRRAFG